MPMGDAPVTPNESADSATAPLSAPSGDPSSGVLANAWSRFGWVVAFAVPLAIYGFYVTRIGWLQRERLNPDAICYIRRAVYLCSGDFYHAISGYWSPLISWCTALGVKLGYDGLYSVRVVLAIWGAILIIAFGIFLYTVTGFGHILNMLAMVALAMFLRLEAVRQITPDNMLTACLLLYLSAIGSRRLLESRRLQFAAGALGGLAYLAKAYAFPFVLLHLPLTFAIRSWVQRKAEPLPARGPSRSAVSSSILAILGFTLIAGPWVGVLSWRYGRLTFSTVGPRAHAIVGPAKGHPFTSDLPADPYIYEFENPENLPYQFWNPLASSELARLQLSIVRDSLFGIPGDRERATGLFRAIGNLDRAHLGFLALCISVFAAFPLIQRPGQRWITLWLTLTIAIYCAGLLPIFSVPRYFQSLLVPLTLVLGLRLILFCGPAPAGRKPGALRVACALAVIASFALKEPFRKDLFRTAMPPTFRTIAHDLAVDGIAGPIAADKGTEAEFVTFFLGQKFVHVTPQANLQDLDQKLHDERVVGLLIRVGTKDSLARELADSCRWRFSRQYGHGNICYDLYLPPAKPQGQRM